MRQAIGADLTLLPPIGPRLCAIARRVPPGSTVADVGTDHGLLPVYLVRAGIVRRCIGIDSSAGSILVARRNCERFGARVDLRLGKGLAPLVPGEAEVLILAGLGAQTIVQILSEQLEVVSKCALIIVQPMRDLAQFRRWADRSGLVYRTEDLVTERRQQYSIMCFEVGHLRACGWDPSETGAEYEVTAALLSNPCSEAIAYLQRRLMIRQKIADALARSAGSDAGEHEAVVLSIRQALERTMERCSH